MKVARKKKVRVVLNVPPLLSAAGLPKHLIELADVVILSGNDVAILTEK